MFPCIFVNHGAGPAHIHKRRSDPITAHILDVGERFNQAENKPKAILVISAHHEASPSLKVSSGFQSNRYDYKYPVRADPELAQTVQNLLQKNNIRCVLDKKHELDHGASTPLKIAFPKADIPVVALSIHKSYDAKLHIKIGEALQPLREQGVLIMGSGMSFHNLGALGWSSYGSATGYQFDQKLTEAITDPDPKRRNKILSKWDKELPGARNAHPEEDHLMPLMVVAGAAGPDIGQQSSSFNFMGAACSGYSFQ